MAALETYTGLQEAILDWLLRAGDEIFEARVPNLIRVHEVTLEKTLRSKEMQAEEDLETVAGEATLALPDDYQEFRSLTFPDLKGPPLDQYAPEALDEEFAGVSPGRPVAVSVWGGQLRFGPTPSEARTARLRYYKKLPRLSIDAPVNDVLTAHPDLYLYGPLLQAAPTLKDQTFLPVWRDAYTTAIDLANEVAQRSLIGQAKIRRRYGQ